MQWVCGSTLEGVPERSVAVGCGGGEVERWSGRGTSRRWRGQGSVPVDGRARALARKWQSAEAGNGEAQGRTCYGEVTPSGRG